MASCACCGARIAAWLDRDTGRFTTDDVVVEKGLLLSGRYDAYAAAPTEDAVWYADDDDSVAGHWYSAAELMRLRPTADPDTHIPYVHAPFDPARLRPVYAFTGGQASVHMRPLSDQRAHHDPA